MNKKLIDEFYKYHTVKEKFNKIYPNKFAEILKEKFKADKSLWYKAVIPKIKADELIVKTNNDYSLVWETYCACCFKTIDCATHEECYVSGDYITWLCKDCFLQLQVKNY